MPATDPTAERADYRGWRVYKLFKFVVAGTQTSAVRFSGIAIEPSTPQMARFKTLILFLIAFTFGTVTAAVILRSNDKPPAPALVIEPSSPPAPQAVESAPLESPRDPASVPPPSRVIPIDHPLNGSPETTGVAPAQPAARPRGYSPINSQAAATSSCNVAACNGAYRSFDSASCTYQPRKGGARRHCDR